MTGRSDIPTCKSYGIASFIQGDSGRKINILGADSVGHCEKNILYDLLSNSEWLPEWNSLSLQK
jgi:hypothetical protein